jgi:hypothetical protein
LILGQDQSFVVLQKVHASSGVVENAVKGEGLGVAGREHGVAGKELRVAGEETERPEVGGQRSGNREQEARPVFR